MKNKTIWIVNQYASHLEERHLNLATYFAEKGNTVIIITSSFHHGKHEYIFEDDCHIVEKKDNVYFVYLKPIPSYQNNGGKRILNMISFCNRYLINQKKIANTLGKPDYIIASSAPLFMWEIGYITAKKYGAKFIAEFRDIWPLSLIEVQGTSVSHPIVKVFSIIEKRGYRHADAIVGTMPYAYKHVCDDLGTPRNKYYWMPNGLNITNAEKGGDPLPEDLVNYLSTHWCCIYIGSIVKSESVDYIIDAWKKVNNQDICFAIIGDGNLSNNIDNIIKDFGSDRIRHFESISKNQIPNALELAHCCLAAIPNYSIYRFGLSMNKLFDYLFSGKPIVFACSWENVVKEAGGFVVPFGDTKDMTEAIEQVYSMDNIELVNLKEREKEIVRKQYDYKIIADNYLKMMEEL